MRKALPLTAFLLFVPIFWLPLDPSQAGYRAADKPEIRQAAPSPGRFVPGQLIVKFKSSASPGAISALKADLGLSEEARIEEIEARLVSVTAGRETEVISRLSADARVAYAEPNYLYRPLFAPSDTYYVAGNQWSLQKIGMPSAWDMSQGIAAVKVAVIDTGIDASHPDKPVNLQIGFNYVTNSYEASDIVGHGTFVSGLIAAATNNGAGMAGMAPGVTVRMYKELNPATDTFDSFKLSSAIKDAVNQEAKVINLSLGGPDYSVTLRSATDYAWSKGALVVAAVGNCGPDSPGFDCAVYNQIEYPAANPNVMAVGATNSSDVVAPFSTQNSLVAVSAPGQTILSISPASQGSPYKYGSGTSFSAPHVAALAALIWSVNPALSNKQVGNIIMGTAKDLGTPGKDNAYGWGRIDANAALLTARSYLTPTPTGAATPTPTPTPALTGTATAMPGPTGTSTPTATATPTPGPTGTSAPTATTTPTPGPTGTAAPTSTSTPVAGTPRATATPTATPLVGQVLAGWNLISFPSPLQDSSISAVFAQTPSIIRVYTSVDGAWAYAFRVGDAWNGTLAQIVDGRGYWVYATTPTSFFVSPKPPDSLAPRPSYALPADWSTIGVTSSQAAIAVDAYLASLEGKWTSMYNYDPGLGYNLAKPGFGFTSVERFRGYWIFLSAPGALVP